MTNYPRNDDDAKDIRELITNTRGWLALVEGEQDQMSLTDKLLLANINITTAMVIAVGQQTGVLNPQTTPSRPVGWKVPRAYADWADRNCLSEESLRETIVYIEARVPDWQLKKIHAIKEARTFTGLGLKEAKDLIDIMSAHTDSWWR